MAISGKQAWNGVGSRVTRTCSVCGKRFPCVPEEHVYHSDGKAVKYQCSFNCWRAAKKRACQSDKESPINNKSCYTREEIIGKIVEKTQEAANYSLMGYVDLRKKALDNRREWLAALESQMMREIRDEGTKGGNTFADTGD